MNPLIAYLFLTLATWRLSSLFANEDGPFDVFKDIRLRLTRFAVRHPWFYRSKMHRGIQCEWCNSIWFGTVIWIAYLYFERPSMPFIVALFMPLAISTGVIFLKYLREMIEAISKGGHSANQ